MNIKRISFYNALLMAKDENSKYRQMHLQSKKTMKWICHIIRATYGIRSTGPDWCQVTF